MCLAWLHARALAIVRAVVTVCGGAALKYVECSALYQSAEALKSIFVLAIRAVLNPAVSDCPRFHPARCSCSSRSAASLLFVSSSLTLVSPLLQFFLHHPVSCERYDAKAWLKHWDNGFITMSSFVLAYGSTEEKAVSTALDGGSSAAGNTAMPIAGCVCAAVARDGRPHVMYVSFPATSGVPEQCFAFPTSAALDSFMRALLAASVALAAPVASASVPVASEAKNAVGGEAVAQVKRSNAANQSVDAAPLSAVNEGEEVESVQAPRWARKQVFGLTHDYLDGLLTKLNEGLGSVDRFYVLDGNKMTGYTNFSKKERVSTWLVEHLTCIEVVKEKGDGRVLLSLEMNGIEKVNLVGRSEDEIRRWAAGLAAAHVRFGGELNLSDLMLHGSGKKASAEAKADAESLTAAVAQTPAEAKATAEVKAAAEADAAGQANFAADDTHDAYKIASDSLVHSGSVS